MPNGDLTTDTQLLWMKLILCSLTSCRSTFFQTSRNVFPAEISKQHRELVAITLGFVGTLLNSFLLYVSELTISTNHIGISTRDFWNSTRQRFRHPHISPSLHFNVQTTLYAMLNIFFSFDEMWHPVYTTVFKLKGVGSFDLFTKLSVLISLKMTFTKDSKGMGIFGILWLRDSLGLNFP